MEIIDGGLAADPTNMAMLAIWHDLAPGSAQEFEDWHSSQHLPERVTIPGITRARRYIRIGEAGEEYCTVINIADTEVLTSSEYLRRLNAPTPWTVKVSAGYMNFFRCALTPNHSWIAGRGPYLVSVRADLPIAAPTVEAVDEVWASLASWRVPARMPALSLGRVEAERTSITTSETSARHRTGESVTDLVLFGEVCDANDAEILRRDATGRIEEILEGAQVRAACYRLQFDIDTAIGAPVYAQNVEDHSQYATGV